MKSIGLVLELRPGCYDEYKRRHDALWPELEEAIRLCGISTVIYRHGDLLFVFEQAESAEAFARMAAHPVTPRWNKYMAEVLQTDVRGDLWVHELPLAFAAGAFK